MNEGECLEGTLVLDGLVEGDLPGDDETADEVRHWARRAGRKLPLALQIDGNRFSVLGERRPISATELGDDPAKAVAHALRGLMDILPAGVRPGALSTLRSMEYRKGEEVQSLYVIGPGGTVDVRQRTVDADTTPALQPLTRKEKLRLGLTGLAVALLVFLVSSIFVDYRGLVRGIIERVTPLDPAGIGVDTQRFAPFLTVVKKQVVGGRALALRLRRTQEFPRTDADLRKLVAGCGDDLPRRLALEALARGYVRCELFNAKGEFLGHSMQRIAPLRAKDTADLLVPLGPGDERPARVVITY